MGLKCQSGTRQCLTSVLQVVERNQNTQFDFDNENIYKSDRPDKGGSQNQKQNRAIKIFLLFRSGRSARQNGYHIWQQKKHLLTVDPLFS